MGRQGYEGQARPRDPIPRSSSLRTNRLPPRQLQLRVSCTTRTYATHTYMYIDPNLFSTPDPAFATINAITPAQVAFFKQQIAGMSEKP